MKVGKCRNFNMEYVLQKEEHYASFSEDVIINLLRDTLNKMFCWYTVSHWEEGKISVREMDHINLHTNKTLKSLLKTKGTLKNIWNKRMLQFSGQNWDNMTRTRGKLSSFGSLWPGKKKEGNTQKLLNEKELGLIIVIIIMGYWLYHRLHQGYELYITHIQLLTLVFLCKYIFCTKEMFEKWKY